MMERFPQYAVAWCCVMCVVTQLLHGNDVVRVRKRYVTASTTECLVDVQIERGKVTIIENLKLMPLSSKEDYTSEPEGSYVVTISSFPMTLVRGEWQLKLPTPTIKFQEKASVTVEQRSVEIVDRDEMISRRHDGTAITLDFGKSFPPRTFALQVQYSIPIHQVSENWVMEYNPSIDYPLRKLGVRWDSDPAMKLVVGTSLGYEAELSYRRPIQAAVPGDREIFLMRARPVRIKVRATPETPNKSPEPTPTAVTPRADEGKSK